ncbi:T9SS type A sorting domain-containing protein [Hymenobacter endophyticus]|uniref:T9SS type A sorting domain-containing protein n=1 Tax=Hymenobacter endophyticus TaxID=3076335 RepID=A0ABU3TJP8_9BACT|nr:T9SS type A sorting domain-containing protein [Hymenobacter endophyticus]MDU0371562.1 T9SS type A sorting domain-containing protein [Hymenobacter endophyticus]
MLVHYTLVARYAAALGAALLLHLPASAQTSRIDPTFSPVQATLLENGISVPATIQDIVRQADGKYIIAGNFTAINGAPASGLARLEASGTLDAAFTAACQTNGPVSSLALQPDGRLLVGGSFTTLAGSPRAYVGRLEPSGVLDASFAPYAPPVRAVGGVSKLLIQPDGKVLVAGLFNLRGAGQADQYVVRLSGSTGQYDPSFQFTLPTPDTSPRTILVQPDGHVLMGGNGPSYRRAFMLTRLRPDGFVDAGFNTLESTFTSELNTLALDALGRIYAGGMFQNGPGNAFLRRYLPNGTIDPDFNYPRTSTSQYAGTIAAIALQPNGRLLVAQAKGVERLLPNGSFDTSFITGIGGTVRQFLVQPDGAIMVAGTALTGTGATGAVGLVRILDANVLRMQPSVAESRTAAWPVPAHDMLHLELDAASKPQRVQVLDALGRPILTLNQPGTQVKLPLTHLAAGVYQVRVEYANAGQVRRRVVVQ